MFGVRINEAKSRFFDRQAVMSATDRQARRGLSRFGAFVRQRAISSMLGHTVRKGFGAKSKVTNRQGSAAAGQPPVPHLGLLVKWILFAYDAVRKSVIIGPAKIGGRLGNAPEALEKGGPSVISAIVSRQSRRGAGQSIRQQVTAQIHAHPYMQPAFDAELPKLPGLFAQGK